MPYWHANVTQGSYFTSNVRLVSCFTSKKLDTKVITKNFLDQLRSTTHMYPMSVLPNRTNQATPWVCPFCPSMWRYVKRTYATYMRGTSHMGGSTNRTYGCEVGHMSVRFVLLHPTMSHDRLELVQATDLPGSKPCGTPQLPLAPPTPTLHTLL
jgi:hypothetical protein